MADAQHKSWWVVHRDALEAGVTGLWHEYLAPVAKKAVAAASPIVEQAMTNAGLAVVKAVQNGAVHGSDDVIDVALKSIRADAPHLEASLSTALAASVVAQAHEAAAQQANDPGAPPASGK